MPTSAKRYGLCLGFLCWTAGVLVACIGPNHPPPPFDPERDYRRVEIVSHRGCHQQAPENTYAAARRCIELGVQWIEVDVRQSRDGVFFLLHDATLNRTTDGIGRLDWHAAVEIDQLDAGSWFGAEFAKEKVPRLEEFLLWVDGRARIYIDAKVPDIQPLVELVRRLEMTDQVFFWFGNDKQERLFRQLAPEIDLMTNAYNTKAVYKAEKNYRANIIETELNWITADLVDACRQTGIKLMLFVGNDDPEQLERAILWGADMINLDHPEAFLAVQKAFFAHREQDAR